MSDRPFLTARWESLVMLNYRCPPERLTPLVPVGTELDRWNGVPVVSLVAFLFADTKVKGVAIPGHRTFEEVNLRFYVRRDSNDGVRRGVVFIRELVPRRAITGIARLLYNEPYQTVPMTHAVDLSEDVGGSARYGWIHQHAAHAVHATVSGPARQPAQGSEAAFITEHYWGYTRQRNGTTLEYRVEHTPWRVWTCADAGYEQPADSSLYGSALTDVLASTPVSAFVAVGSAVRVWAGKRPS